MQTLIQNTQVRFSWLLY